MLLKAYLFVVFFLIQASAMVLVEHFSKGGSCKDHQIIKWLLLVCVVFMADLLT
jgi:hypothetical protein